jgi:hypothetical protein
MCADKAWSGEIEDKYTIALVHITKVEKRKNKGLYEYFFPPRIGIDFYHPEDYANGYHDFIPNLELGDIARLIQVLELVKRNETFDHLVSGKIKPFRIGLAFERELKRRISVRAKSDHVTIGYEAVHSGSEVSFEYEFTRVGLENLVDVLKEVTIEYISFIQRYVLIGKIDSRFK